MFNSNVNLNMKIMLKKSDIINSSDIDYLQALISNKKYYIENII
jgi:hypothetical protein